MTMYKALSQLYIFAKLGDIIIIFFIFADGVR